VAARGPRAAAGDAGDRVPQQPAKFITDETEKWAKVIRAANIKAE